ncbi:5-(carboxyamino)imidazole ribonucleotide synthase [Mycolicibacterium austroafricanum]|uniref:N5-carboxyaminoimidazole ribonucleotide synthase n=1 Tax=Mycolicibacterium austroafricanum TaxID=39687 RepID=A0ABT8HHP2_MYCAO|nr:5-(carboxyamino)imidazole ribonucleotide synthase [Mycolicibacterium austroafricanum]MDN4520285.1 5-(carboxyamino)imidazole ribonucleotide synthase [Mycolicibacterium austroafricanum]
MYAVSRTPASPPVVAMIGGGQLARMTAQAAIALGQTLRVLAVHSDESAAQVTPDVVLGSHTDLDALRRVADGATAFTFDHEHVPPALLEQLVADGVNVLPPPAALVHAQDKLLMRERLSSLGVPVPRYTAVGSVEDAVAFCTELGGPVVIKTVRGGYDGRGVIMASSVAEVRSVVSQYLDDGVPVLIEERVAMRRELAALVARSPFGQGAAWPVVETVQRDGICVTVLAPAPGLSDELGSAASELALSVASSLGVVGVLAVELFETVSGGLLVNELAMRPHNSGHWTMDGARTSQFEQHLRAVLDYPLGDTSALAPTAMGNVLGAAETPAMSMDERVHHLFARMPDAKVHLYGKEERPGRKIGHVNIVGGTEAPESLRERAERAAHWLSHAEWTDGWDPHSG